MTPQIESRKNLSATILNILLLFIVSITTGNKIVAQSKFDINTINSIIKKKLIKEQDSLENIVKQDDFFYLAYSFDDKYKKFEKSLLKTQLNINNKNDSTITQNETSRLFFFLYNLKREAHYQNGQLFKNENKGFSKFRLENNLNSFYFNEGDSLRNNKIRKNIEKITVTEERLQSEIYLFLNASTSKLNKYQASKVDSLLKNIFNLIDDLDYKKKIKYLNVLTWNTAFDTLNVKKALGCTKYNLKCYHKGIIEALKNDDRKMVANFYSKIATMYESFYYDKNYINRIFYNYNLASYYYKLSGDTLNSIKQELKAYIHLVSRYSQNKFLEYRGNDKEWIDKEYKFNRNALILKIFNLNDSKFLNDEINYYRIQILSSLIQTNSYRKNLILAFKIAIKDSEIMTSFAFQVLCKDIVMYGGTLDKIFLLDRYKFINPYSYKSSLEISDFKVDKIIPNKGTLPNEMAPKMDTIIGRYYIIKILDLMGRENLIDLIFSFFNYYDFAANDISFLINKRHYYILSGMNTRGLYFPYEFPYQEMTIINSSQVVKPSYILDRLIANIVWIPRNFGGFTEVLVKNDWLLNYFNKIDKFYPTVKSLQMLNESNFESLKEYEQVLIEEGGFLKELETLQKEEIIDNRNSWILRLIATTFIGTLLFFRRWQKRKKRSEKERNALVAEAKQASLSPHFLKGVLFRLKQDYNKLPIIERQALFETLHTLVSETYNYNEYKTITIRAELHIAELLIQYYNKTRYYHNPVQYKFDEVDFIINENYPIPPLLIFNAVDNALSKGFVDDEIKTINVTTELLNDKYFIEVTDNGIGFDANSKELKHNGGIGKNSSIVAAFNTTANYKLSIEIKSKNEIPKGTSVIFTIKFANA